MKNTNIKAALAVALVSCWLASPRPAQALEPRTLAYVCDRMEGSADTVNCFRAARGLYIDSWAAGACDRIETARGTIACVDAIAGRLYSKDEVVACDRIPTADETTACLRYAGQWAGGYPGQGETYRGYLQRVIRDCRAHNTYDRDILRCIELSAGS